MNGGFYGNLNSEYSPMYSPKSLMKVTMNGQLFLCMLAEQFEENGIHVDMANTDGITILIKNDNIIRFNEICKEWEKLSRTQLEEVEYSKVVRTNINNYLAFDLKGKPKEKGMFQNKPNIGNSTDNLIIPKAIKHYYVTGKSGVEFILNHQDIYDFCASQRVDRNKYDVLHNGEYLPNKLNRYYASENGAYLYKQHKETKALGHLLKDSGVTILNKKVENYSIKDFAINYTYYITEYNKLLAELNKKGQLSLF